MHRMVIIAMAMLLSGCPSQVFLDGSPKHMSNVAAVASEKHVRAVASEACSRQAPALPYQLLERGRDGWVRTCAKIEGFSYQPGNDYLLEVTEQPVAGRSLVVRLVLKEVIEVHPHSQE